MQRDDAEWKLLLEQAHERIAELEAALHEARRQHFLTCENWGIEWYGEIPAGEVSNE